MVVSSPNEKQKAYFSAHVFEISIIIEIPLGVSVYLPLIENHISEQNK